MSDRSEPDVPVRRILLVGFMGSGKSTVGRRLARELRWRFVDFDLEVERRAGMRVAEIFRTQGESAFRQLEAEVGDEALTLDGAVLSTGGGWPVRDDRMGRIPPGTATVWLQVDAGRAVARALRRPGVRPLLDDPDPLVRAVRLLAEREPEYARAEHHVKSGGASLQGMVQAILRAVFPGRTGVADAVPPETRS